MSDGHLHKYFLNNADKRLYKWIHYFDIYERHFSRFRNKAPVMIEIGVFGGGSLAMWRDFFGPDSTIIGIDINPECKAHEADGIEIFIGSQDDPALIEQILQKYPNVDIVLDDGSHIMEHMVASFELIYHRLNPKGVYMVEDTHTCYWPEYQGGLKQPGSFMEFTKNKMDELNAVHTRGAVPVSGFTKSTDCITSYDSIVVFERRPQGARQAPITLGMAMT
ncbi:CmcI family methyltransferase [uncultured Pseudomonas sp.]|uniref:CmcI family methyltransferase n=1 Tax=uncultured Pseudomonas sp. TaxID=114707 RepID=UPI0030D746C4|tara:strand:- start:604 stop:1266 length:663 start_codon:yes stop_codon:yes gene_type:complete